MITLLSAIFGFVSSFLPNVFKMLENKQNNAYNLELQQLEIKRLEVIRATSSENQHFQAELAKISADASSDKTVHDHDVNTADDTSFFGKLRASIRPVVTYTFFLLFLGIKLAFFWIAWNAGAPLDKIVAVVWDETTAALFGSIIGFWFGGRVSDKTLPVNIPAKIPTTPVKVK